MTGKDGRSRSHGGSGGRSALTRARVTTLLLVALAIVLIVENTQQVTIRLVVPVVTMPLYLALLIMFVIGGLCGALVMRSRGR
ncbi:LapA family protein [Streptomyces sp. NPDC090077]|uniref:LapA family protein n=1 Tax=Streptomyces sp. NPDC090077 TaxID=3365938 RepID=UPI00380BCC06